MIEGSKIPVLSKTGVESSQIRALIGQLNIIVCGSGTFQNRC